MTRRFLLVCLSFLMLTSLSFAQDDSDQERLKAFEACAAIIDDGERLACYDRAAGASRTNESDEASREAEALRKQNEALKREKAAADARLAELESQIALEKQKAEAKRRQEEEAARQRAEAEKRRIEEEKLAAEAERQRMEEERLDNFGKRSIDDEDVVEEVWSVIAMVRKGVLKGGYITLENGQVWQQMNGQLDRRIQPGQKVVIEPGSLGSFKMKVEGIKQFIRVKRYK